ncbi:hypothetical protein SLAV_26425 [Streptomyces lavendulae subsp. lavendulae]|uniref:Uncharacterized protein n=1 Tax=Streptomyces lavendulae subsp. lavendulae TaxID=58340 RepID=A0A2K8PK26_STRLA|nr:hypothetical protein [Streptomyces lavendulae]ATZ27077.1 hypothetical protein SLAV_26425 [Streptomyces lavendulae subsp. lavendulae]QUQ56904.1 hypothetical protein SLLC_24560 [Streptomyces lavendulae subsp. lavendulae]
MTSEQPETSRATRRRPAWAIGSIAAAVLLAGGGTAYWASTAYGDASGSRTRTSDSAAVAPRPAGSPSGPGIAPGEPDPSGAGVTYRAEGPLPQAPAGGAPSFAASGEVSSDEVARLARALGISGAPRLSGEQWQAGEAADGSGPRLTVSLKAPGTWSFSRFQGGAPNGGGAGDDCVRGKDTCGPATLPQGPAEGAAAAGSGAGGGPVSEEAAKAAAAPVLAAAGQGDARQDARLVQGSVRVVGADPVVGGLPTTGWSTRVSVGSDAQVVAGSGELKAPVRTGEQPVVGADEALARLNAAGKGGDGTGPGPSGCATSVPLTPDTPTGATDTLPCNPEPRPMKPPRTETVRGAVLGLAPGTVDGGRGLVPAWLFEVAGKDGAPGRTVASPAGKDGAGAPVPPKDRTAPAFSYAQDDRKLTVNFWGSVCSTYALEAREEAGSVLVKVTDTPKQPGQACIMLAQEMTASTTLREPLGDRKVVDATTGKTLPRQ